DRTNAVQSDTAPLEAALLQHAPRCGIADARTGLQLLAAEHAEGMIDHGTCGLGGVATAPEFGAEPVADLSTLSVARLDAAGADDRAVRQRDEISRFAVLAVDGAQPAVTIGQRIRMRDARGVLRDADVVRERRDGFRILKLGRPKHEARGNERLRTR